MDGIHRREVTLGGETSMGVRKKPIFTYCHARTHVEHVSYDKESRQDESEVRRWSNYL